MGCDIHIAIQRREDSSWVDVPYQVVYRSLGHEPVDSVPEAPEGFDDRNYDLFAILANVRNGRGFAGIKMGEGWPSIAEGRGFPEGFDPDAVSGNPADEGSSRYMGDHSFTWVGLDELKAFDWDGTESWLYGVVTAEVYEALDGRPPTSYSGGISGPGIVVYEPDGYKRAKAAGTLAERPYVRMGWPTTAREATYDWPGKVLPWLDGLAAGRELRLVLGFDS